MSNKTHVYFMPGLAASPAIFERIKLSEEHFCCHLLSWEIPEKNESLESYAAKMASKITESNPVLIGVSFGGILVQEMKKFINPSKVIVISSVKSNKEFPRRFRLIRYTKAYKLLPTSFIENIEKYSAFAFTSYLKQRFLLYEKFLDVRDKKYISWAVFQILHWKRTTPDLDVIHIHGDRDEVFPVRYIHDCVKVNRGTHIMILTRYKWFNENLPKLILDS